MEVLENQHHTFDLTLTSAFTANKKVVWGNYASIQLILLSSELVQLSVSGLTSPLAASRGIVIDAGPAQPSPHHHRWNFLQELQSSAPTL